MLKLDRVEISGFKSFLEKVDLAFPGSVTAIVGPNGCGKSNICDAVAWALGEQSARLLRGERMDDVIFNGSAKRRPIGMAEVVLTLSPRTGNGNGNGEDSEAMRIGRRVYRDGHGEYFLNDKQVRLKDIQDRLLGTGLGVRAYSVIEQGRIDQVLSTKPQDRRRLIEEAAGITRYKLKKRLAEIKLEETKGNMLRISDIVAEIERQCASLKRQASRAARYKEHSEALRQRRSVLARARFDRLEQTRREAARGRDERRDREAQAAAELARAEAELAAARLAAADAAGEHNRLREAVAALEAAIERDDALLESNRRAAADLGARREALERESRGFSQERERAARELSETDDRLERAVAEARSRSLAREEADRQASEAAAAAATLEEALEAARAQALSASGEQVAERNARHEVDLEASRLSASLERLRNELTEASRALQGREEELASLERERDRLALEAAAAAREAQEARARLDALEKEIAAADSSREAARETLGGLEHRLAAVAEVLRAREESVEPARAAVVRAGFPEGGPLSRKLRPASGWEDAVDILLAEDLQALLAPSAAVQALARDADAPPARLVRSDWKASAAGPSTAGALGGWEVAIANHADLSPAERAALPAAAFVEDLEAALAFAERHPGLPAVTRAGDVVRGSFVRLSRKRPETAGLFGLRREREELAGRVAAARRDLESAESEVEALRSARVEREAEEPGRHLRERTAAADLSALEARLEERRAERDRVRRQASTLGAEAAAHEQQATALSARRGELESEEGAAAERESALRARADALAASLPEARSLAMSASEELAHRRTEAEVAAERRRSLEAAREKLLETQSALERRAGEALEQERQLAARGEELAREEAQAKKRRADNVTARAERSAQLTGAASAAAETAARVTVAEETGRMGRTGLDTAREARFEAEVSETRVAADLEHLVAQAREEFGQAPSELPAPEDVSEEALARLESEAADLAASLERLGPVNVLAFEEHRELSERLSFLTAQRDDLLRSIAELQESIRKINATSSERFAHAFAAINENFKQMFGRLFQGGTAQMRLLDENDPLESGVEIVAQPPGKRNQSILLLSGGEKALTAIALLMAIFRYKPSPFCILDEVDAPLDEANIDRFTRLLREMTEETQFIAITHNKRTMETADALYGVTMEEPGCSKIVSVKFD